MGEHNLEFNVKLLIITGASAGIGAATAKTFLSADYTVINLSRRPCPIEAVCHVKCDLANPSFIKHISEHIDPILGKADEITLIHNASRLNNDSATTIESAAMREVFEINIFAPSILNHYVIPHMNSGSSILYVGSTLSEKAVPGTYSYVVSKHATVGMMRATCQDLIGTGIHTACICPGFTDTEMLRDHVPESALEEVSTASAFGRLIQPHEISDTLFFAARNPVINGAVIHANLGQRER